MVVVPEASKDANPRAAIVATLGFDDRHFAFRVTSFLFNVAVNCSLELLSCLGVIGETFSLLSAYPQVASTIRQAQIPFASRKVFLPSRINASPRKENQAGILHPAL